MVPSCQVTHTGFPVHVATVDQFDQGGQSLSLDAGSSNLSRLSNWRGFVECGVQSEPGDECDRLCERLAEVEQFQVGLGVAGTVGGLAAAAAPDGF